MQSLFDQTITFRLKELQAATKAIHDAEAKLAGKTNAQAAELVKQARDLAFAPVVSRAARRTEGLPEAVRLEQEGSAVAKQITGLEGTWNSKAQELREGGGTGAAGRGARQVARRSVAVAHDAAPAPSRSAPALCARPTCGASGARRCVLAAIAAFLLALLLVVPVGTVFVTAFREGDGTFTLGHFATFFSNALMRESFFNSLYVAGVSVVVASLIAVPLAYLTVRFQFRGALLIQTLGVLPLIMPPFVGAVAMQLIFGRSGSVNLLLEEHSALDIPFMQGLNGVIFVESLHYFPFILMNLIVALRNIDGAMEEAALNLGAAAGGCSARVVFPLALPGYLAGAALVFVKVFDDLGTPLVLGQTNMLAPQAYLRITQVGLEDPLGYVISVIMIAFSILALWLSVRVMKGKDYSTLQKGGAGIAQAPARRAAKPCSPTA